MLLNVCDRHPPALFLCLQPVPIRNVSLETHMPRFLVRFAYGITGASSSGDTNDDGGRLAGEIGINIGSVLDLQM